MRSLGKSERGSVLIELGMILPVMFSLVVGLVEISMLISVRFKTSNTSNQIALPASISGSKIDEAQLKDVIDNIDKFVAPIKDFSTSGKVIIAAVQGSPTTGVAKILWNRCGGNLSLPAADVLLAGTDGSNFNMPDSLDIGDGLTAVVVQTSYKYKPMFLDSLIPASGKIVTKTYVHRSRYGEFSNTVKNDDNVTVRDC
jgi:Flp pilus assembly protein TadG